MSSLHTCLLRTAKGSYNLRCVPYTLACGTQATLHVCSAEDLATGKRCTTKLQFGDCLGKTESGTEDPLMHEATLMQLAVHKHVAKCLDYGQGVLMTNNLTVKVTYLLTDSLSDGTHSMSLQDAIAKSPHFDARRAKSLFVQLAKAVRHIHELGVVHNCLNLDNVYVDQELSCVQVANFESAQYYPPSAREEQELEIAKDVYALGVMLFCLTTKHYPFGVEQKGKPNDWKRLFYSPWRLSYWQYVAQHIQPISVDFINLINAMLEADSVRRISTSRILSHRYLTMD